MGEALRQEQEYRCNPYSRMIYVVIGQSGAGKTTFCKKNFLIEPYETVSEYPVACTKSGNVYALGKYGIGIRTEGTDTLSYSALPKIIQTVKALSLNNGINILMEGDRINNDRMFLFLATLKIPVKLYLITCKIATSMKRLRASGSTISEKFVKTTRTKALKRFMKWGAAFKGEVINTDEKVKNDWEMRLEI